MPDLWTDLLACLDIAAVDDAGSFEGRNQRLEYHRVFGGQLLAQFIRIASLTCPDKAVKSQRAVFAREGRADEPIHYDATLTKTAPWSPRTARKPSCASATPMRTEFF